MSNIVDKLIYNTLITDGCVTLPELGSVRLAGEPRVVSFEEHIDPEAPIITEVIERVGNISAEEAAALYGDWLSAAKQEDGAILLDGVGLIPPRKIKMDSAFDKALNHSFEPLPTAHLRKRRTDAWLWWILGIAIAVFAVLWAIMPWDLNSIWIGVWNEEVKEVSQVALTPEVLPFEEVAVTVDVTPEVKPEAEPVTVEPQSTHPHPATNAKRYNISVGVYSSKQNARDCVRRDPLGIGQSNYLIDSYPGDKWVVMAHSTNTWAEADKLRNQYKRKGKEVWIYQRY